MKRQALIVWLVSAAVVASSLACTVSGMESGGIRGSGRVIEEVRYAGHPTVKQSVTGSGDVTRSGS